MARIPVEHERRGSPWWLWLLGLLLLAGLIWLLAELFEPSRPSDEVVEGEVRREQPTPPAEGAAITNPEQIVNATEPASLVGRRVQLDSMRVVASQGDSIFVVEPANAMARGAAPTPNATDTADAMDTTGAGGMAADTTDNRILVVHRGMGTTSPTPSADSANAMAGADVTTGDVVRITGTVQEMTESRMREINVPGIRTSEIVQNGLYIQADDISPMSSARGTTDTTRQPSDTAR